MTIRIGLIGLGGIMNGMHIPGYEKSTGFEIAAVCDINPAALQKVGDKLNVPEDRRFLNYEELMDSGLVDAVDIATPDYLHCPIALAAVNRGLKVCIEKPMGMTYSEVDEVCRAAKEKNLPGAVCFSWHYRSGVRKLREIVQSGELGPIYHIYIRTIKDSGLWDGRPLEWRFDGTKSASGVMGDLSSHMFDIARFAGSEFESLVADAGIFIKERRELNGEKMLPVTTWDWCNILARMENGANATFQISRTCKKEYSSTIVELYGHKGKAKFVCENKENYVEYQTGSEPIKIDFAGVTDPVQSQGTIDVWNGVNGELEPTLEDGRKCQAVLDAAFRSVEEGRWVTIREIMGE